MAAMGSVTTGSSLIVDHHRLGGFQAGGTAFGHDQHDRFADETDPVAHQ